MKERLRSYIRSALETCYAEGTLTSGEIPDFTLEVPANPEHGDFAVNTAMVLARSEKKAPRKIAEALVADMNPRAFSYGYDSLRFVNPVTIGTTLSVHREVVETAVHDDSLGRVVYRYVVEDESGETLLACEHITLVERAPADG